MLDRFTPILTGAVRLGLTENVMAEFVNLMTRAYELGIQAKNDTPMLLIVVQFLLKSARFMKVRWARY